MNVQQATDSSAVNHFSKYMCEWHLRQWEKIHNLLIRKQEWYINRYDVTVLCSPAVVITLLILKKKYRSVAGFLWTVKIR